MTEYEMASLANDLLGTASGMATTYFTVVSGFIAASFVAAHRLSRSMVVIVVALFAIWAMSTIGQAGTVMRSYYGLLAQIRDQSSPSGTFGWYAIEVMPRWFNELRPTSFVVIMYLVGLAAIYFFFHCRRVNRKAELAVEAPKT